jgi:hypothetical protein
MLLLRRSDMVVCTTAVVGASELQLRRAIRFDDGRLQPSGVESWYCFPRSPQACDGLIPRPNRSAG